MPLNFNPTYNKGITNVIPSMTKYSTPVPLSTFEGVNQEDPSKLGTWYNNSKLGKTSLIAYLIGQGFETTASGSTVMVEEVDGTRKNRYDYPGLITRSGNDFTINPAAVSSLSDKGYFGMQVKPEDLTWILPIESEIIVYTETGNQRHGTVRAISPDGRTITATCGDLGGWASGAGDLINLTVVILATRNAENSCGDCFSIKPASRFISNNFNLSSKCYSYNPNQLLANNTMLSGKNGKYFFDYNMDKAITDLYLDIDNSLLRSQSPVVGSADYIADPTLRMKGMLEQLLFDDYRAKVHNEYLTTMSDFIQINDILDQSNAPDEYMILCNTTQYNFLQQLMSFGTAQLNPYKQLGDKVITELDWLNFDCLHIGGRKFHFSKWSQLSQGAYSTPAAQASNPTYIMMPKGYRTARTKSDNMESSVPYVSLIWSGDEHTNMKLLRRSNEGATNCLTYDVSWYSRYTLMVVGREHFIVGLPNGFDGLGVMM